MDFASLLTSPGFRRFPGRLWPLLLPAGVLVAGWLVSLWIYVLGEREQSRDASEAFRGYVATAEAGILQRFGVYRDALRAGASHLRASRSVTRKEWREFAETLDLGGTYPGILGIGVIFPVEPAGLEDFLRRVRADGEPGFALRQPAGAESGLGQHAVITYIEPQGRNLEAVGLDVWSEPNRREAARAARDLGETRLTQRIRLVQAGNDRAGFLFYLPVYRSGTAPQTVAERRRDHVAWVYGPILIDDLLRGAGAEQGGKLRFWLFDGEQAVPESLLHASDGGAPPPEFERQSRIEVAGRAFTVGWGRGRAWPVVVKPSHRWTALTAAGATVLLAGLVVSLQSTSRRAHRLAEERTAEVRATQRELEAVNRLQRAVLDGTVFSVISTRPDGTITTFNTGAERMLGYRADEMIGRCTPALIHSPEEVEARARELAVELGQPVAPGFETFVARARLGAVDEREWTYVRKDGTRLPVWLSVTALRDAAGGITGFLGIAHDLTERKRAEAKLIQSERFIRAVTDGLPGMVAYWSRDLRCTFSNHAYLEWFGRTRAQMEGIHLAELMGESLYRANQPFIQGALSGVPQNFERILTKPSGEVRHTWAQYVPDFAADGVTVNGFLALVSDITDVKRKEEALLRSEQRLADVFRAMAEGLVVVRDDGVIVDYNASAARILGLPAERPEGGVRFETLGGCVRSDGSLAPLEEWPAMITLRTGQPCRSVEVALVKPDGAQIWLSINCEPMVDAATGERMAACSFSDISERRHTEAALKESEERTRIFAEHAPASVAMFDREMRYLVHSRQWLTDYHLEGQALVGRSHYEVFPEIGPAWKAVHQRCLAGAIETREADPFVRQDGTRQWIKWEVRPWHRPSGEIGGIVMFTQDITARKELEDRIAHARDEALEASRLKTGFLATMSHEIRTPMNAIVGMAGLLADTTLDAEQREMLRTMSGGAEGLLAIINDALDLSRIEAGQLRLDPVDFDLRRVVEETVALLAPPAHAKRLSLVCEFDPAPDCLVRGDAGRVRQILLNLIGNAVKFTAAGQVRVLARAGAGADGRLQVRIEVHDTGCGIPEEARSRLFRPFFQVDDRANRALGGTGLGLAISRQLAAAMGGTLDFQSEVGRGSVFWVELGFERRGPLSASSPPRLPPGRRVLVIEPNAASRAILGRQLTRLGAQVETAADDTGLLNRLQPDQAAPWDLILIDEEASALGGVALAASIHAAAAGATVPLVLLVSSGGAVGGLVGPETGLAAVLTKPVVEEKLARVLTRICSGGAPDLPEEPPPIPARPARALRFLLAEDNAANQRVASLLLDRMGHSVTIVGNGAEALRLLASQPFDAVLMDCQMPVLDGYEATRRIRSGAVPGIDPRIPIIALTAYARAEDRTRCLEAGMNAYVSKPIRVAEFHAAFAACRLGREAAPGPEGAPAGSLLDPRTVELALQLQGRDGGTLLAELAELYLRDEAARLNQLARLLQGESLAELAAQAHAFGSNVAALGAVGVRQVALELEAAARRGSREEAARQLEQLVRACAGLREELARYTVVSS